MYRNVHCCVFTRKHKKGPVQCALNLALFILVSWQNDYINSICTCAENKQETRAKDMRRKKVLIHMPHSKCINATSLLWVRFSTSFDDAIVQNISEFSIKEACLYRLFTLNNKI